MIENIMELLNKISNFQIIPAHTIEELPRKVYGTYSIVTLDSKDYFGSGIEEKAEDDTVIEKKKYREIATVQFDIYAATESEAIRKARELQQLILYKLRYEWSRIKVGIAGFSLIKNLNELIHEKYEYRNSFDVKFEYLVETERKVELAKTIELIANEIREETNGNI